MFRGMIRVVPGFMVDSALWGFSARIGIIVTQLGLDVAARLRKNGECCRVSGTELRRRRGEAAITQLRACYVQSPASQRAIAAGIHCATARAR